MLWVIFLKIFLKLLLGTLFVFWHHSVLPFRLLLLFSTACSCWGHKAEVVALLLSSLFLHVFVYLGLGHVSGLTLANKKSENWGCLTIIAFMARLIIHVALIWLDSERSEGADFGLARVSVRPCVASPLLQ